MKYTSKTVRLGWSVGWLFCLMAMAGANVNAKETLPNIVVYIADDHSQFDSSLYGAADIPTPHMEALAADGMLLTHAFIASPACAPSRSAMLTGLMPARNGAEANHTAPREGAHYLIQDLQALGYQVAAFGKVDHGRKFKRAGFDINGGGPSFAQLRNDVPEFLADRKSNQPLCLFVGISNPHVPWPAESSFDPAEVVFPPHHLDTPETRRHRASYYQEIHEVDLLLGELRQLAHQKLGANTVFIYTADHGSQWAFGKWNLYDYGTRVPFIAAWPGVIQAGSQSNAMVSWIDLIPTLLDLAGGPAPSNIDGQSFAPVLRGEKQSHRERIFTTHSGDGNMNIYPIRSVRTRDWKLVWNLHPEFAHTNHSDLLRKSGAGAYWTEWARLAKSDPHAQYIVDRYFKRPQWELYKMEGDKWELTNLADDPNHQSTLRELKIELKDWMQDQGDEQKVYNTPRPLDQPETWHLDFTTEQTQ